MAPESSSERLHLRALQLLDELHRIGFEQLRFSRSFFTIHVRLQIYAARSVREQDGFVDIRVAQFTLSSGVVYVSHREDSHLVSRWQALLEGAMKPQHLAGLFVLDFPEIARLGFGADHDYREWFRMLRPFLEQDYLPMTWAEDPYGSGPDFSCHVLLYGPQPSPKSIQRPPDNPFVDA